MGPELACLEGGRNVPRIPFRSSHDAPPPPPLGQEIRGPLVVWGIITSLTLLGGGLVFAGQQLWSLRESVNETREAVRDAATSVGVLEGRVVSLERRFEKKDVNDKQQDERIIRLEIRAR